jgi:hypothetical protein
MSGSKPGERRGGRKAGVPNKATAEIRALAREHGPDVIRELARIAKEAQSEQARISACNALLDRAYGRSQASQLIQLDLPDVSKLAGITEALTAILRSTANGELTPSEAQALSSVIETQRKAIESAELERRIERLEESSSRQDG